MTLKVTMLGSGASGGVPLIGCECAVCASNNPKNRRSRVSILIESATTRLMVDTSPDLRTQCLQQGISRVDAILITHDHADHTHGLDDTRSFNFHRNGPVPLYAEAECLAALQAKFAYAFGAPRQEYGWYRPCLIPHAVTLPAAGPLTIGDLKLIIFPQTHGRITSLGIRIGDFAYSTDVNHLPEEAFAALEGVRVWIVDCLGYKPAPTHAHLEQTLAWIGRVRPERAILTHMSHQFDYETLAAALPPGVEPGYDGLVLHANGI